MADFRRWIYALAVVALLAGLSVPASAQAPFTCSTSVTVTPIVRAEGLTELVGDLVLFCTGGTPTPAGKPVPQVNFTVFLNTNITSKVIGAQLVNFGSGQTSALNEALLMFDEPNSPNSPGCHGVGVGCATAYPILNCGAVVGGNAAPDGGPSGPGVCEILAPVNGPGPSSPNTYDGTVAGAASDACASGTVITTVTPTGTVQAGSLLISNMSSTSGIVIGAAVSGGGIPAGTTVTGIGTLTVQMSGAATASFSGEVITFTSTSTTSGGTIGGPGAPGYGCGRPNVFQGRVGALQNPNQYNAVTFLGVPLDPPGTAGRTIRITNIRANAAALGVSSTFTTQQILMNIAINGPTSLTIANPQQIVAYVNRGLTSVGIVTGRSGLGEFVQCISQNPDLFLATPAPTFQIPGYLGVNPITGVAAGLPGGFNCASGFPDCSTALSGPDLTPFVRFTEGFASSWKTKNIAFTVGSGTTAGNASYNTICPDAYCYNGNRNYPGDLPQNVPGAVYNTESGFQFQSVQAVAVGAPAAPPSPNPPVGFGTPVVSNPAASYPFTDDWYGTGNATGISTAGVPNAGTRLYLNFTNVPQGSSLWVPPVIYLFRQGVQHNGDPATLGPNPLTGVAQSQATGVMVLTTTDGNGAGAFLRTTGSLASSNQFALQKVGTAGLVVYEILYTDPFSSEYADVPVVLAFNANPGQNLPAPQPPNPNTQVLGGFAPFYTTTAAGQPSPNAQFQSPVLPVPRFIPGTGPQDIININKCACNLLFPFVANQLGYDTGIAIANASQDPGATYGFSGVPQPGTVQFWYYGDMANGAAVPGSQTSSTVQPGHVLTYVLSTGSSQYNLDGRGAGLIGYIITQAQFQYCHGYAFISAQGALPTTPGVSEGYLAIVLDRPGLYRAAPVGENLAH